jgi:DUF1365 family protein
MHSCIYQGQVRHRRLGPVPHAFRYSLFLLYLDLNELDEVFRRRLLWSTKRPAVAWFRRGDHFGDPDVALDTCVRDLVENETGTRPDGPIRLLTHLRYFGYIMNPVSFFFCFDETGESVHTVVAEVNNTPWKERHCYVFTDPLDSKLLTQKTFHVSPFMGMEMRYGWRFSVPGERLSAHVETYEHDKRVFDAAMSLERRDLTGWQLARVLLRHPMMTMKVATAIYWPALRLKLKGIPFYPHPKHTEPENISR